MIAADPRNPRARTVSPERFRQLLERLGPTFVKVGQFLALRPDLIPQDYCNELLLLTDQVAPFPFEVARTTLAEDLGADPGEVFAWLNPEPLAAASLAQVHLARTHDGEVVAVKVQRPGVREAVDRDLSRLRLLGRVFERAGATPVVPVAAIVAELRRWLHDELDLGLELRNLSRMDELARGLPGVRIPRPYPELSGPRVVTAEYLAGVPLSEVLRLVRAGRLDSIERLGIDRGRLAANLLHNVLTQIFRLQFFHADTHPGNLIAMPDDVVGFVDFGLTETLDPTFRRSMTRYLAAVYSDDTEGMFHGLTELLIPTDLTDLNQFRADFLERSRAWQRERQTARRGVPASSSPVSRYLIGVLRAARENHLRIPISVLALYRSLLTAETVASQLGGDEDLASVGSRFFRRLQSHRLEEMLAPEQLHLQLEQAVALLQDGPGQLRRVLGDLADGRLVLRTRTTESGEDRRQANVRARLVAAATVSVGVAVLLGTAGDTPLPGGVPLGWLLWGLLLGCWTVVGLLWRSLR